MIEGDQEFNMPRARLRVFATLRSWLHAFLQTDTSEFSPGPGSDVRLQSAWFLLNYHPAAQFIIGQHITNGGGRQGFQNGGTYPGFDLYNVAFKSMNLDTRAGGGLFTTIIPQTDAGLRTRDAPRDRGVTWIGTHSFTDQFHGNAWISVTNLLESIVSLSALVRLVGKARERRRSHLRQAAITQRRPSRGPPWRERQTQRT